LHLVASKKIAIDAPIIQSSCDEAKAQVVVQSFADGAFSFSVTLSFPGLRSGVGCLLWQDIPKIPGIVDLNYPLEIGMKVNNVVSNPLPIVNEGMEIISLGL